LYSKTIDVDNSKYFDRVPEIDKAIAAHQEAIQRCLRNEITLEKCSKYQQAVFKACNEYKRIGKKPD
jgi:hypothetical protein